jgi:dTDP-4-amino-4,6-dideoxygalactose transaminase
VFNTFEGGAIVSPDEATKRRIDHLKNFGFVDETTVVAPGINGKMSEINAAMGLLQLKYVDQVINDRSKIANAYRIGLCNVKGVVLPEVNSSKRDNYSYYPILINEDYALSRDDLFQFLKGQNSKSPQRTEIRKSIAAESGIIRQQPWIICYQKENCRGDGRI